MNKSSSKMFQSIETITPEIAERYLENNYYNNRNLKQRIVNEYADDMKNGRFLLNPTAQIVFSEEGVLIDGQHRLYACVQSGVPLTTYVVRNCPQELYHLIDIGSPRRTSDIIGKTYGWNKSVASLSRAVVATKYGTLPIASAYQAEMAPNSSGKGRRPSQPLQFMDLNNNHDEYIECVKRGTKMRKVIKKKGDLPYSYFVWLVRWLGMDSCLDEFIELFCDPTSQNTTVNVVRLKMLQILTDSNLKVSKTWPVAALLYSYTKFMEGTEMKSLQRCERALSIWSEYVNKKRMEEQKNEKY